MDQEKGRPNSPISALSAPCPTCPMGRGTVGQRPCEARRFPCNISLIRPKAFGFACRVCPMGQWDDGTLESGNDPVIPLQYSEHVPSGASPLLHPCRDLLQPCLGAGFVVGAATLLAVGAAEGDRADQIVGSH